MTQDQKLYPPIHLNCAPDNSIVPAAYSSTVKIRVLDCSSGSYIHGDINDQHIIFRS